VEILEARKEQWWSGDRSKQTLKSPPDLTTLSSIHFGSKILLRVVAAAGAGK
jgi:hypothetical protein